MPTGKACFSGTLTALLLLGCGGDLVDGKITRVTTPAAHLASKVQRQQKRTAETHFGHKNVFFRDTEEGKVPIRAIAAPREQLAQAPISWGVQLALAAMDFSNRDFYLGIQSYYDEIGATPVCERGVDSTRLPADCLELAHDPGELFAKLDDWGFDALVIPHGNAWGLSTPLETTWDKQLSNSYQDPKYQKLIEIYSGHGNSEEYRDWRRIERNEEGNASCPLPSDDFLPCCWRAGGGVNRGALR